MRARIFCAALLLAASAASARVISYSPYTNRIAYPVTQRRTNRFFALVETPSSQQLGFFPFATFSTGQLVLYDSKGEQEPRVIFPTDSSSVSFSSVAVREENGVSTILLQTNADFKGLNPSHAFLWLMSTDSGTTWKTVAGLGPAYVQNVARFQNDVGGPFVNSRYSPIQIGTKTVPFIVQTRVDRSNAPSAGVIDSVGFDGSVQTLFSSDSITPFLFGTNADGSRVLARLSFGRIVIVDAGGLTEAGNSTGSTVDGWITPNGDAYILEQNGGAISFVRTHAGERTVIASQTTGDSMGIFAVPTVDYSGAWIIQRGQGRPTVLSLHTAAGGLAEQWSDVTAPEVEALHAGASGNTLLVQVHRPRIQMDTRIFKDPALALWHTGETAPRAYDELFMNEELTKGFVHLDVENAYANGDPFVFDSGAQVPISLIISPAPTVPVSGGSDVTQEWGVVRASFKQRLVLPGMARTNGAFGSYWLSDVILHNPLDAKQNVTITYVPTLGYGPAATDAKLTLEPNEIRVVSDALKSLFGLDTGGGALFITPDSGINVTSRTYTRNDRGTYGFGMNGIDFYAGSASPRFPVTFSGAFPGPNFRTNLVLTDVGTRGAEAALGAVGIFGAMGATGVSFDVAASGQQQFNGISAPLGLLATDSGALVISPTRGEAIASVIAIDNRTNDPTYFPPDLPSPILRTIPAIGHLDGVNGAKFRSDLYMYNPSATVRTVTLQVKSWDVPEQPAVISFTMLPNEARVIPDVLFRLFGKTGIARLRYQSSGDANGVRVTSRTYSIDENGGTYGFLMPPLNNFQSATSGDTLEILGVVGGKQYRTNVGLVELTAFPSTVQAAARIEIIDDKGKTIDSFTVNVPVAGGIQINDIFHARNLGDGPAAALIRVSPLSGLIGAYAALNDNGTNDPTYLAANLGARQ